MNKKYQELFNSLGKEGSRSQNDHVLIIDSMNTFIRSFAMLKTMNPVSGNHVGGLIGFLRSVGYLVRTHNPTRVICVFDGAGSSTHRKNINPEYKAQRIHTRITNWGLFDNKAQEYASMSLQLGRLVEYLQCLPFHLISIDKMEADDIMAHIAQDLGKGSNKVTIVSSDKDFLQIINDNIQVYAPIKKVLITDKNVREHIQVPVENYLVVKALLGDKSDNLEGIKGLGPKTLYKEFPEIMNTPGTGLDYIFEVCESKLEDKLVFAKIIDSWDKVETNYELMNIKDSGLSEKEVGMVESVLNSPVPKLFSGGFLQLLEQDEIEGITKNTEGWLENFRHLSVY